MESRLEGATAGSSGAMSGRAGSGNGLLTLTSGTSLFENVLSQPLLSLGGLVARRWLYFVPVIFALDLFVILIITSL
jgi:hypothetical protein